MDGIVLEVGQPVVPPILERWVWAVMETSPTPQREIEIPIRREFDTSVEVLISLHMTPEGAAKYVAEERTKPLTSAEHRIYADVIKHYWERGKKIDVRGDIFYYRVFKQLVKE